MTVKELIDLLGQYPDNTEVICNYDGSQGKVYIDGVAEYIPPSINMREYGTYYSNPILYLEGQG